MAIIKIQNYYFEKVLEINDKNKNAHEHLGVFYLNMSRFSYAWEKWEELTNYLERAKHHATLSESGELLNKVDEEIQQYISQITPLCKF